MGIQQAILGMTWAETHKVVAVQTVVHVTAVAVSPEMVRCPVGGQMAERLGNRAINQKVVCDVVSLGKALHPTCLRGTVPVLTVNCSG